MDLPTILYIGLGICTLIIAGIIYSLVQENDPKNKTKETSDDITIPENKSYSIIRRATNQARNILVQAELTGIKEVARTKHDANKLENAYEKQLDDLINKSAEHLERTSKRIEEHYINLFKNTESFVNQQIRDNQQRIVNQLDLLSSEAEKTIETQAAAAQEELQKRLEAEFDSTRKQLKAYQDKKMELIDQKIVELVQKTIMKTLGTSLTSKDQAALILQALSQAKEESFFS